MNILITGILGDLLEEMARHAVNHPDWLERSGL